MGDPYTCNAVITQGGWCYFCRLPFGHAFQHEHGELKWADGDKNAEAAKLADMPEAFRAEYERRVLEDRCTKAEREVAELREALERFAKEWRFLIQIGQLDDHGELAQAEAALKHSAQGGSE